MSKPQPLSGASLARNDDEKLQSGHRTRGRSRLPGDGAQASSPYGHCPEIETRASLRTARPGPDPLRSQLPIYAVIYARYSSEYRREASIEDQVSELPGVRRSRTNPPTSPHRASRSFVAHSWAAAKKMICICTGSPSSLKPARTSPQTRRCLSPSSRQGARLVRSRPVPSNLFRLAVVPTGRFKSGARNHRQFEISAPV